MSTPADTSSQRRSRTHKLEPEAAGREKEPVAKIVRRFKFEKD